MKKLLVKIFRKCRFLFLNKYLEKVLVKFTQNKFHSNIISYLCPLYYHYPLNTIRTINRDGIKLQLDLSDYNQNEVYFGIKWHDVLRKCINLIDENDIVFDVGTNFGYYLLKFGQKANKGKVIGFEPFKKSYDICLNEIKLNPNFPIKLENIGLGETDKLTYLLSNVNNSGENRILFENEKNKNNENVFEIKISSIDNYCQINFIERINFIKIDTEGYEWKVILGAKKIIENFLPIICLEINEENLKKQGDSFSDIFKYFKNLGYLIFNGNSNEEILQPLNLINLDVFLIHPNLGKKLY